MEEVQFTEQVMRKAKNLDEAIAYFLPLGYGYKAIVKLYQEAHEVIVRAGFSYSVAPYAKFTTDDLKAFYEKLPLNFKTALPVEQVDKLKAKYDELAKIADGFKITLKEASKLELERRTAEREKAEALQKATI